jgi:PAS domain S-box-containing protein
MGSPFAPSTRVAQDAAELQARIAVLQREVAERTAQLERTAVQLQQELTRRKASERALSENKERMELLCKTVPIGVFQADANGSCVYANEYLQALCGLGAQQCLGDAWYRCLRPENGQRAHSAAPPPATAPMPETSTCRLVTAAGQERWVSVHVAAIQAEGGRPAGHVGTVQDITEQRRAEAEIRHHELDLMHLARVGTLGEMGTMLAHELNQPLAAIANYALGGLERVRVGRATVEALAYALAQIAPEAKRAGEIIRSMREFVRRRGPEQALASAEEMIRSAVTLAEPQARAQRIRVRVRVSPGLPPVLADRVQIEQVLLNLLRNGLEAMEGTAPERRELTVAATCPEPGWLEVAVRDHGNGLDELARQRLFEPFFTTKPNGMGVGLTICRSVVQNHGGRLWVESEPGRSSTFRFRLPVAPRDQDA